MHMPHLGILHVLYIYIISCCPLTTLTMLSGIVFRPVEFKICLPVSAHGTLILIYTLSLSLFTPLTYYSVLHWMFGLYYYGFLVNEGIDLIFVIETFSPSVFSILCS